MNLINRITVKTKKIFFIALIFFSCNKDENSKPSDTPAPLPVACFTVDENETVDSTHVFSFTNCSQNVFRSEWDFGDFTYAPVANPFHLYNQQGKFVVHLTVYNTEGISSSINDTVTIGNYMLDKVVYHQLWAGLPMPIIVGIGSASFGYYRDTISNQGVLPFSQELPDSSLYDMPASSVTYSHQEIDSAGITRQAIFAVSYVNIADKMFNGEIPFFQHDTAKFTMYYKIVPR